MIAAHDLRRIAEDLDRVGGWSAAESMIRDAADEIERLQSEEPWSGIEGENMREAEQFLTEVRSEVRRAETIHKPINSLHEGYAVILDELDEFWEEVRKKADQRDPMAVREELIQTAAMCVRTSVNVLGK